MRSLLFLLLCLPISARAADWTVGPGGELPFDFAQTEASAGEFRAAKTGVIYRAPLEAGTFTLRGRVTPDGVWGQERVTVVAARLEVKSSVGTAKWRDQTEVMTGGLNFPEYQVNWRVIFPTQVDPTAPLPIGRVELRADAKNTPRDGRKTARLIFDAPTRGRFVSSDLLQQNFFLRLGQSSARIRQSYAGNSDFVSTPYFVYGRPEPVDYGMLFGNFFDMPTSKAVAARGQTVKYYSDTAQVLRWDGARRDFVGLVISSHEPEWKQIEPLIGFAPVTVTSPTGVYSSRLTQRVNRDYLLDGVNAGVFVLSLYESTALGFDSSSDDSEPDFDDRLRQPATPPPFPIFERARVEKILREIERDDNAALLRVGLLSGHFQTPISAKTALELVNRQLKSEAALSPRWLHLQRLRAWGEWHAPHGGGAAMAVYSGVLGRGKELIARGQSELLGRVLEDWQSLVTGPYYQNAHLWGAPAEDANVAALDAFLRLEFARQTATFDGENWRYIVPENGHIERVEKLERDSSVAHNFWFYLGAGEILAGDDRSPNPVKALELLEKARALAPADKKARLRLYQAFDAAYNWRSQDYRGQTPKVINDAIASLSMGQLMNENGSLTELTPVKRAELEQQVADYEATAQGRKSAIQQRWIANTRERVARLGTGYNLLYRRLTTYNEELSADALELLRTMAPKAPEGEILEVSGDLLGSRYYDADFSWKNPPAPDENSARDFAERRTQNQRQRELDRALHEQGEKLLENYLKAPRARTPKFEFMARLQWARYLLGERRTQTAALAVAATAPAGAEFDDYRAAQKWIAQQMAGRTSQ